MELLDIAATYGALKGGGASFKGRNNGKDSVGSRDNFDLSLNDNSHLTSKQLGIDMLLRLGHWSKICRILLNEGEIYSGVRLFLEKYPFDKKSNTEHLQLSDFLTAAMSKDPICFYHLYNGLNMIISSHHSMFHYYSNFYQSFTTQGNANNPHNVSTPRSNKQSNDINVNTRNKNNTSNKPMISQSNGNVLNVPKPKTFGYSKSDNNLTRGSDAYEYNHDSTITNLSLLFSEELMTFQSQFDALHENFSQ